MRLLLSLLPLLGACTGPASTEKGAPTDTGTHETSSTDTEDSGESTDTAESGDTSDCRETRWYDDADGDGKGDPEVMTRACEQPEGTVSNSGDCDDTRSDIYTNAPEICEDGIINDCNDPHGEDAWPLCVTTESFSLSLADAKILGEEVGDLAGTWVDAAGDVNGDGRDDLLIGALYRDAGTVYIVLGPVSGTVSVATAMGQIQGEDNDNPARGDIGSAGDVNGDDYLDFIVGAPDPGRDGAYLVFGPVSGTLNLKDADALWAWEIDPGDRAEGDLAGQAVAGVGDTNEDGFDDVIVGAPWTDGHGEESELGRCPAEADDEGDEYNYVTGAVYLLLGPSSGAHRISEAEATLYGEDGYDAAGYAVANAGDQNGDGLDDLLIGAPYNCEGGVKAGAAYVVFAPVSGEHDLEDADFKMIAENAKDGSGREVRNAGDTNADGYPDILVSAPYPFWTGSDGRGTVYLVEGPPGEDISLSDASATVVGEADFDNFGWSATAAGDIDLDGHGDILLGAYRQDAGGEDSGASYLIYGPISGTHPLSVGVKMFGPNTNDFAGLQGLGVGDTNADGYPDLLIGAAGDDEAATSAGAAYLILGGGAILSTLGSW